MIAMHFIFLVLAITLGLLVFIQSTGFVTAQEENGNVTGANFLFIQNALSSTISEVNDTTSTLELNDVSDKTTMFSDRPDRIVAVTNTTDFIDNWSTGPDSFAIDPPNAVIVLDDEVQRHVAVIELFNPEYDPEANTLKYDIAAVNATTTGPIGLPGEFGQSTLVIDGAYTPAIEIDPREQLNYD
jgi:ABC-type Fe3+-hydroxamate transport system substrate-binding protein